MKQKNLRTKLALTPTLRKIQELSYRIASWLLPGDVSIMCIWIDGIGKTGSPKRHFKTVYLHGWFKKENILKYAHLNVRFYGKMNESLTWLIYCMQAYKAWLSDRCYIAFSQEYWLSNLLSLEYCSRRVTGIAPWVREKSDQFRYNKCCLTGQFNKLSL